MELKFGYDFNHPIQEGILPSIEVLEFGASFNHQSIKMYYHNDLRLLDFGHDFNRSIGIDALPP